MQPGRRLADAPCDPLVGCCTPRTSRVERSSPPSRVLKAFHHTFSPSPSPSPPPVSKPIPADDSGPGSDGQYLPRPLHDDSALRAPRRARGGKGSRTRRLEKYNESKVSGAQALAHWTRLTQEALRLHRANLRGTAKAGHACLCSARTKIRRAVWQAWTRRSLRIAGPRFCEVQGELITATYPIRGDALEPLSRRDMWVLKRASAISRCAIPELLDPMERRGYRHVLDWLFADGDMTHTREAAAKLMALKLQPEPTPKHRSKRKSSRKRPTRTD